MLGNATTFTPTRTQLALQLANDKPRPIGTFSVLATVLAGNAPPDLAGFRERYAGLRG
jgi:hypothetical protein